MNRYLFTSESVTEGHPDKLCDCVADAILDALLAQDPNTRCACEVTACLGKLHIMGEVTTAALVDYEAIVSEFRTGLELDPEGIIIRPQAQAHNETYRLWGGYDGGTDLP